MRSRPSRTLFLLALFITALAVVAGVAGAGAGPARAGAVGGQITDAVTGAPLPNAYVYWYTADGSYYGYSYADANGEWMIAVGEGAWKFRFSAGFHVDEWWSDKPDKDSADLFLVTGGPQLDMNVALARSPQAHLQGTITDGKSGDPIKGVSVTAMPSGGGSGPYVDTAADGTYDLTVAPGSYKIAYQHYAHQQVYWKDASTEEAATVLTVEDGDQLSGIDEALPRTDILVRGWAHDVDGTPGAGLELQLVSPIDAHVLRSATTDAEGMCSIDVGDLVGQSFKERFHDPSGFYADLYNNYLSYGTASFADAATVTVALGGIYWCALDLYSTQMGEIKGRTLNAAGEPVPNVPVWVKGATLPNYSVETVSDANGYYDVTGLRVSRSSAFTIVANPNETVSEYMTWYYNGHKTPQDADEVQVGPGQTVTVDTSLYRKGAVEGTVGDAGGAVSGIEVTLYEDGVPVATQTTGAAGAYQFRGRWPGTYTVGFHDTRIADPTVLIGYKDTYYGGPQTADATKMTFDGRTTRTVTADVDLEPWGGVKVDAQCALDPYSGIDGLTVTLYDADKHVVATRERRSGNAYLFQCLPLGTYYLAVTDPRKVFKDQVYDDVASLDGATRLELTRASSKANVVMRLMPVRGVSPDFGALPDGSTTTASLHLGVYPQAMASSGDTTLICGQGGGAQNGCFVFQRGDAGWAQKQLLTFPSARGYAVDVDADLAAVTGVNGSDADPGKNGKLYVFRRTTGVWALEATLQPTPDALSSGFGLSVAISGDTILVGAPDAAEGYTTGAGAVYVYVHGASGWTQQARLTSADVGPGRHFGAHLALDADRALVSTGGLDNGAVDVWERSSGSWQKTGRLVVPGGSLYLAEYGAGVALQGDRALVGAPGQDLQTGAVYVFGRAADAWSLSDKLTAADGQTNDCFGRTVDLLGDNVLVGAPSRGQALVQYQDGAAYLFRHEDGVWRQDAEMLPVPGVTAAHFGAAVALAGRDLFVGAQGETRPDHMAGRVHVFSPYVTDVGAQLTTDAGHGVLVNDIGPEGYALSAELVTSPSHGVLQLGTDGSFVYTPAPAFVGVDQFTYRAVSGDWRSDAATVDITVRGTAAPTLSVEGAPTGWVNTAPTVQLTASATGGIAAIEVREPSSDLWTAYDSPIVVTAQGASTYAARTRDVFGNVRADGFTVKLDRTNPVPKAPNPALARHGRNCTLGFTISDEGPGSPTANVRIVVKDLRGKQKWSGKLFAKPVNKKLTCTFRCKLAVGKYRFYVHATDAAGNAEVAAASNKLTVK